MAERIGEWKNRKKTVYSKRIGLAILLVSILPLGILSLFSYKLYVKKMVERADMMLEAAVTQAGGQVNSTLSAIWEHYLEAGSSAEMREFLRKQTIDTSRVSEIQKMDRMLGGPVYLYENILGYTCISFKNDWVISSRGIYPYSSAKNREDVERLLEDGHFTGQVFLKMDGDSYTNMEGVKRSGEIGISSSMLLIRLEGTPENTESILLVNLDDGALYSRFRNGLGAYDMTVMNQWGQVISGTNAQISDHLKGMDHVSLKNGNEFKTSDGNVYRMAYTETAVGGLIFVATYNTREVTQGAEAILALGLFLAAFILIAAGGLFAVKWLYRPVRRLREFVDTQVKVEDNWQNEWEHIKYGIEHLSYDKERLERFVDEQKEQLLRTFVMRMIRAELSEEKIAQSMERYGISPEKCYMVMAMDCIFDEEQFRENGIDQDAVRISMLEELPPVLKQYFAFTPIYYSDVLIFVASAGKVEDLKDKAEVLTMALEEYGYQKYDGHVILGVSRAFHQLTYMKTAFNESMEALKSNTGISWDEEDCWKGAVTYYDDFQMENSAGNVYNQVLEQEMVSAVDSCDKEESGKIIDEFLLQLNRKNVSSGEKNILLYRLFFAILQVGSDAGVSADRIFGEREVEVIGKITQLHHLEQEKAFFKNQVADRVIDALMNQRQKHSTNASNQIMALIKKRKGDITVAECAELLNYHPGYIWRVLKQEKNMSFTDLAALEKVEAAKHLLLGTSLSVAEIAARLNYSNTQNFIRFFSKYALVTPGRFRKTKKEEEKSGQEQKDE